MFHEASRTTVFRKASVSLIFFLLLFFSRARDVLNGVRSVMQKQLAKVNGVVAGRVTTGDQTDAGRRFVMWKEGVWKSYSSCKRVVSGTC